MMNLCKILTSIYSVPGRVLSEADGGHFVKRYVK